MNNDIDSKQNQVDSITLIAAFRQKYSDIKRLSLLQVILSVWFPVILALVALILKSQTITSFIGITVQDVSIYVAFYCVAIALADLFLFTK